MQKSRLDLISMTALIVEWLGIALLMYFALRAENMWVYCMVFVVVATRQHALLMLYHDAVHGLLARKLWLNDALINFFVGVPHCVPIEIYRPLHLQHHRKLGTTEDPERTLLFADQQWNYQPLSAPVLLRQLLGDLFVVNGIRTLAAWRRSGHVLTFAPTTVALFIIWLLAVSLILWNAPVATVTILILWFGPLLTLTNLLQKVRSFAEHSGGPFSTPGWGEWTYSWRTGWLGKLTIWPYNINRHLEHHAQPTVPWYRLHALLEDGPSRDGRSLWSLLHKSAGPRVQN